MRFGPDQFHLIPRGHYRVVYGDPPTKFSAGPNKNPSRHYPTMKLRDIAAMPVHELFHPEGGRILWWTTPPLLLAPFGPKEILKGWGVRYSTVRVWVKLYPKEEGIFIYPSSTSRGSGYETSGDAEFLIIGKWGRPEAIAGAKPRGVIYGARREHSRKPDEIRAEIARLFKGPRIELFGRSEHDGWDVFGNETDKFTGRAA